MSTKASHRPKSASSQPASPENPLLGAAKRRLIESTMRQLRSFESKRAQPLPKTSKAATSGKTATGANSAGMEAALAALAIDLRASDAVAPSDYGPQLALVSRLSGSAEKSPAQNPKPKKSLAKTTRRPVSKKALSLAAQWNLANGLALSHRLSRTSGITLSIAHPGNDEMLGWQEALVFAAAEQLPVLFALWRPMSQRPSAREQALRRQFDSIRAYAHRCSVPLIPVDGTDYAAVYRVTQEASQRARNGDGPTIIECWSGLA